MSSTHRFEVKKVVKKPRKKALPVGVRNQIKKMLIEGKTRAQIKFRFKKYAPSDTQIDAIKYNRVKLTKTKRCDSFEEQAALKPRTGKSVTDLLHEGLLDTLEMLSEREKELPIDRVTVLEKAARIDRHVKASELEAHLKNADAAIIAAIIKRYEPEANNERIVKIYREELAKIQQDLKNE